MWAWTQAKHWLPLPLSLPVEAAGNAGWGWGAEEIPFYFEKIAVFDYPIIPNYKAGTTMDFP